MSIEFGPLLVVLLGVPLAAAALGTFLAARSAHRTGLRIIGSVLAILGFATSTALWVWFDRDCYETWQPCGKAPGVALWLLWSGMALAVVIAALSSLYLHFSARHNRNG